MDPSRYGSSAGRSSTTNPTGFYHGTVKATVGDTVTVQVPRLFGGASIPNIPVVGALPSVNDAVFVSFIEGRRGSLLAFSPDGGGGGGGGSSVTVSDDAPTSPSPDVGDLWYESDTGKTFVYYDSGWVEIGGAAATPRVLEDADADTKIQVEESGDEDQIRFDTAGSERMVIDASGNVTIGASDFTVDTDTLYVDAVNDRVGIGTLSPAEMLDIAIASGSAYVRQGNGTATTYLGPDSANTGLFGTSTSHDVRFITGNTERVRIDTSGNVGIGTTSPLAALDMSDGSIAFGADSSGNALGGPFGLEVYSNDTLGSAAALEAALYYRTTPNVWVFEDGAGTDILSMDTDDLSSTFGGNVTSAHHFTAQSGGADGGIVLGQTYDSSYVGLRTAGMGEASQDEYVIMSNGSTTFISGGTGGDVYIRGGANNSSCQIALDTSADDINVTGTLSLAGDFLPNTDSSRDLGSTSLRWSQVHADRYYVNDTDTYIEYEADGGSGVDGPGIKFMINGSEMFKFARENNDSNHSALLFGENNDAIVYHKDGEYFAFWPSGTERMRLRNNNTGLTGASSRGLSVRTGGAAEIWRESTGASDGILALYSNNGSTTDLQWLVYGDGDTASDTGSYGTISDNRLKTNITQYHDPTDDLMAINVIKYDLSKTSTGVDENGDPIIIDRDEAKTMTGWEAQQVQSVKPGFVKLDNERGILSVKSSVFTPLLHRGFQVHEEKIQALQAENDELRARIEALEAE